MVKYMYEIPQKSWNLCTVLLRSDSNVQFLVHVPTSVKSSWNVFHGTSYLELVTVLCAQQYLRYGVFGSCRTLKV